LAIPSLQEISEALENDFLIRLPDAAECDAILRARDEDEEFDRAWSEADRLVGEPDAHHEEQIDELARAAFLAAEEQCPQHEIAACVADDIELIARASATRASSPFVEQLWSAYRLFGFAVPGCSSTPDDV
jgi:hypothetical protein